MPKRAEGRGPERDLRDRARLALHVEKLPLMMRAPMSVPVQPGDVLAGKYRVARVLGKGGMGVVVAARHLQLDQMVALKFLLPQALGNQEAVSRFLREARNAVRLKSEHVARISDVGTLEDGAPYIVMEFLEGTDLTGLLAERGPLPVSMAVDFVLQACDAIAEAHSLGIIHRDLKPQNLFVSKRHDNTSIVKVLDFGISKSLAAEDFTATSTQAVMGTPAYMSPEQMRSTKSVDVRTDVWALGVILYELVTGEVPWKAETFTELCFKVAMDPLPPLPPGVQQGGFEEVVRCCLEKDPARRFANVHALASALAPFAPPHARPLVERIGRVLRGSGLAPAVLVETISEHGAVSAAASQARNVSLNAVTRGETQGEPANPETLGAAAGQSLRDPRRSAKGSRGRRLTGVLAAVVLAGGAAIAVVLAGGRGGESAELAPAGSAAAGAAAQPTTAQPSVSEPTEPSEPQPTTATAPTTAATTTATATTATAATATAATPTVTKLPAATDGPAVAPKADPLAAKPLAADPLADAAAAEKLSKRDRARALRKANQLRDKKTSVVETPTRRPPYRAGKPPDPLASPD